MGVERLLELGDLVAASSLYETAPVGGMEQEDYLNAVIVVDTSYPAHHLLEAGLAAERTSGRERRERWGPRTLDVDVLLYGDEVVHEPGLEVPHPRMTQRRFVLEPLVEAWPDAVVPGVGPASSLLEAVGHQSVRVCEGPEWVRAG